MGSEPLDSGFPVVMRTAFLPLLQTLPQSKQDPESSAWCPSLRWNLLVSVLVSWTVFTRGSTWDQSPQDGDDRESVGRDWNLAHCFPVRSCFRRFALLLPLAIRATCREGRNRYSGTPVPTVMSNSGREESSVS